MNIAIVFEGVEEVSLEVSMSKNYGRKTFQTVNVGVDKLISNYK